MGNVLNVSFHPSEIGKQLDLLYISFKRGARRELTQVVRVRQVSSGRETVSIKEHYKTEFLCVASVNGSFVRCGRCDYEKHSEKWCLCVRSSESANMHYTLISN